MANQKTIIIKKVKKHGGGGHHGGSWKVAYADFVTAMMAFFLLLWLLNMSSPEKRARLSYYFKHFSLYTEGGTSFMDKSSEMFSESGETSAKVFMDAQKDKNKVSNEDAKEEEKGKVTESALQKYLEKLEKSLQQEIMEKIGSLNDQVLIDATDEGIRIQMIDKDGSLMFKSGSNKLTGKAKDVLHIIGENIKDIPNKVTIEGHTDSVPFGGNDYSNWELSTERASSARKELEANGLDPQRITKVAGYADTLPFIKENTADPRNRRISIILQVPKKERKKIAQKNPSLVIDEEAKAAKKQKIVPLVKKENKKPSVTAKKKPSINVPAVEKLQEPIVPADEQASFTVMDKKSELINNTAAEKKGHAYKPSIKPQNREIPASNIKKADLIPLRMEGAQSPRVEESRNSTAGDINKLSPVIQKKILSPVFQNEWSPVIQKDSISPVIDKN